ncbi:MAG: SDR family oxidoreductase [Candidatus Caenarcaniphilales bacterium]|nr:SDR family oxidoreductase [Candidatus Caenarcaniphilales bacterium]
MDFQGTKVLITGASGEIGSAIARHLAKEGADIFLQFNTKQTVIDNLASQLKRIQSQKKSFERNSSVHSYQSNLINPSNQDSPQETSNRQTSFDQTESRKLIETIIAEHGGLDILINCIGDFSIKPLTELSSEEFKHVLDSNLSIAFDLSQAALKGMKRQKNGKILHFGYANASSIEAKPNILPYHIAKMGLILLTKSFAQIGSPDNVFVNCISPGVVESSQYWPTTQTNLGRPIKINELIEATTFLLKSDYLNGVNLELDSGWRKEFS